MPTRAHDPEPDPSTFVGLAFRILDRSRRTANLVAVVLTVLLPVLGVTTELLVAGRLVGTWSLTGLLSGVAVPALLGLGRWLLRRWLPRRADEGEESDLGGELGHGYAEHPPAETDDQPDDDADDDAGD